MNENIHKMILDRDVEISKLKDKLLATNIENERLLEELKYLRMIERQTKIQTIKNMPLGGKP